MRSCWTSLEPYNHLCMAGIRGQDKKEEKTKGVKKQKRKYNWRTMPANDPKHRPLDKHKSPSAQQTLSCVE